MKTEFTQTGEVEAAPKQNVIAEPTGYFAQLFRSMIGVLFGVAGLVGICVGYTWGEGICHKIGCDSSSFIGITIISLLTIIGLAIPLLIIHFIDLKLRRKVLRNK